MAKEKTRKTQYYIENFADGIAKMVVHTKTVTGPECMFNNKQAAVKHLMDLKKFDSGLRLRLVKKTVERTFNDWV